MPTVLERGRFENISYAHLNHFTIRAIDRISSTFGLGVETVSLVDTDGGSFVACLRKGVITESRLLDAVTQPAIVDFLARMRQNGDRLRDALSPFSKDEVVGYGAGAKGPFLLSLYDLGPMLKAVVDDNASFHGQYLAGTGAKVVTPAVLQDETLKAVLILAPTHTNQIAKSLPPGITAINVV